MILKTSIRILYKTKRGDKDITQSLAPDLLSFTYTDKLKDEVDEIAIKLKDDTGKWRGEWIPKKGDTITCLIISDGFGSLMCGRFNIDSITASGPPSTLEIKALAIPFGSEIRRTKKSVAWEGVRLSEMAQKICANNNLNLGFLSSKDPYYDRQDQKRESDAGFLQRLCKESALAIKFGSEGVWIFDEGEKEKVAPVKTIYLDNHNGSGPGALLTYSIQTQLSDNVKKCQVSYNDPKSGEVYKGEAVDENPDQKGQVIKLIKRATSREEAERLAASELKKRNKIKISGDLSVVGDVSLHAGKNVELRGFGWYDGNYAIEQSVHSLSPYVTKLKLRNIETPADKKKG